MTTTAIYTMLLFMMHFFQIGSSLFIYQTFFFTALSWMLLLTIFAIAIIFEGKKAFQYVYLAAGLLSIGYELYMTITYQEFIENFTTNAELKFWLNKYYLAFVCIHFVASIVTIMLSLFRFTIFKKKKPQVTHIL
eukprot:NODE_8_length_66115_cov_0.981823.p51 type:complete len:135 gc:universal NODE_8_length_66115_cov_0.981823:50258-49854(-)